MLIHRGSVGTPDLPAGTRWPAARPTSNIRDAAKIMTARHYRHLPVIGDAGLLGVIDITDVCQALIGTGQG